MKSDPLEREYGILLAIAGPHMMERAFWYTQMANLLEKEGCTHSVVYLRSQAQRAEETVASLGKKYDAQHR